MSTGFCECCGDPSTTWIGNTEVCEDCHNAFYNTILDYIGDAIIDIAEDYDIDYEDAYDEAMELLYFNDLKIPEKIAKEEQAVLAELKTEKRVTAEKMGGAPWHNARLTRRVFSLMKQGYGIRYDIRSGTEGWYLMKGEEDGHTE